MSRCLRQSRVAALHVLGRTQKGIAQKLFSSPKDSGSGLKGEPCFEGKTSAPILKNLPTWNAKSLTFVRNMEITRLRFLKSWRQS